MIGEISNQKEGLAKSSSERKRIEIETPGMLLHSGGSVLIIGI